MKVNGEGKRERENAEFIKSHFNIRPPFTATQQKERRMREEEKRLDKREFKRATEMESEKISGCNFVSKLLCLD